MLPGLSSRLPIGDLPRKESQSREIDMERDDVTWYHQERTERLAASNAVGHPDCA